jgi:DNA-directed RNA polymerase specialized sigma24 family protein
VLLARQEFAVVREALGLPEAWASDRPFPRERVRRQAVAALEPRQRQALGLKYLGYADKEMAALMGVRPGVPRSYLSEARRTLGLATGAAVMLYVYFTGLDECDALPLLVTAPCP